MKVYLDYAATTPLLPEVKEAMTSVIKNNYGNPSSIHGPGRQSKILIEDSRKTIAEYLNASIGEIYFVASATEANNMALLCSIRDLGVKRIISSPIEHHCVLHTLQYIREQNLARVDLVKIDNKGNVDMDHLSSLMANGIEKTMVSLMHANNEIGTMIRLDDVSQLCDEYDSIFHCDTAQSMTKYPINLNRTRISFLAGAPHKFFGPKGVGFLYVNNNNIIKPLIHGGGQERGMRSGTENIYSIVGTSTAFKLAWDSMSDRSTRIIEIRNYMMSRLTSEFEDIRINGNVGEDYLYTVLSVSFPPSEKADMLMMNLDIHGISASSGSACASGAESDSHVLQAIRHDPERKTIRFSFSHFTSKEEIDYVIDVLHKLM